MNRTDYREVIRLILSDDGEAPESRQIKLKLLGSMLDSNLTKMQKCYIIAYYKDNMKISEIADRYGVVPSTVSRTISRARKRLFRAMTGRELFRRYSS